MKTTCRSIKRVSNVDVQPGNRLRTGEAYCRYLYPLKVLSDFRSATAVNDVFIISVLSTDLVLFLCIYFCNFKVAHVISSILRIMLMRILVSGGVKIA